jgi:hypothetical protein
LLLLHRRSAVESRGNAGLDKPRSALQNAAAAEVDLPTGIGRLVSYDLSDSFSGRILPIWRLSAACGNPNID